MREAFFDLDRHGMIDRIVEERVAAVDSRELRERQQALRACDRRTAQRACANQASERIGNRLRELGASREVRVGDLIQMASGTPLFDYNGGGSLASWNRTMEGVVSAFDFDLFIPGHGPVSSKAAFQSYQEHSS